LERDDIVEIIDWLPPAIVTTSGELLLVSRTELDALKAFCARYDVPFNQRYDVWSDLLDPFLDTEFSDDMKTATRLRLKERGRLTDCEIDRIRNAVERKMLRRTALTWEWQQYGLADVLIAMRPKLWIGRSKWAAFYAEAMEIGLRGSKSAE